MEFSRNRQMILPLGTKKFMPGLLDRKEFASRLSRLVRQKACKQHAVIFLDIDNFQIAHVHFGHQGHLELLEQIAQRIQSLLSSEDYLSHQGNDKFLLCLADFTSRHQLTKQLDNIMRAFHTPFEIHHQKIYLSASLGVALSPEDSIFTEELLHFAHDAWYCAKKMGKNNYQFYAEKNASRSHHHDIENRLYFALSRNEFSLLFQPQFDTVCGVMIGMEALLRWENSEIGCISPLDFIPIAEKTGLIFPISDWVIRQACQQLRTIPTQQRDFRISINLSAKEFLSPTSSLTERLRTILEAEDVEPSRFELEITETSIMENYTTAVPIMCALKKEGFHIACDDFGIGYSSLNHLKRLPVDTLKIDKSFVDHVANDIHDNTIIQAILLIAKIFHFRVIAEGIEQPSQVEALRTLGCNLIQGYYFSKPTSLGRISKMMTG